MSHCCSPTATAGILLGRTLTSDLSGAARSGMADGWTTGSRGDSPASRAGVVAAWVTRPEVARGWAADKW